MSDVNPDHLYDPDNQPDFWDEDSDGIHPDHIPHTWYAVGGNLPYDNTWTADTLEGWLVEWGNKNLPDEMHESMEWPMIIAEWEANEKVYIGGAGCYFRNKELARYFGLTK